MTDACVKCNRTADELGEPAFFLWRQRPLMKSASEYALCLACARLIKEEQDERAQAAIRQAERAGV